MNTMAESEACGAFDPLRDWLQSGGAQLPKMEIRHIGSAERGLFSREPLACGERLMCIPRHLVMCSDLARESQIGRDMTKASLPFESQQTYLAAFILTELEKTHSPWHTYLNTLPKSFEEVPIFFKDEWLEVIKGSLTHKLIQDRRSLIRGEYAMLCEAVPSFASFPFTRFSWTMTAVDTRCFVIPSRFGGQAVALVPFADMGTHDRSTPTQWSYSEASQSFHFTATSDMPAGVHVSIDYGTKTKTKLFVRYGRLEADPSEGTAEIEVPLLSDDPWRREKAAFIRRCGGPIFHLSLSDFSGLENLLSAIRCALADWNSLTQRMLTGAGKPHTRAGEHAVFGMLADLCRQALARFSPSPTSHPLWGRYAMDDDGSDEQMEHLLEMRDAERSLLYRLLDFAKQMGSHLAGPATSTLGQGNQPRLNAAPRARTALWHDQRPPLSSQPEPIIAIQTHLDHGEGCSTGNDPLLMISTDATAWPLLCRIQVQPEQRHFTPSPLELIHRQLTQTHRPTQIVAIHHGMRPIGMFTLSFEVGGQVWLDGFQLDRDYQGQGIGRRALRTALNLALGNRACRGVWLKVHRDNLVGIRLFAKEGFSWNTMHDGNPNGMITMKKLHSVIQNHQSSSWAIPENSPMSTREALRVAV
ncbi:GNAT family N-acetyltransferase [Sulfidibacter corallicola]|uniref:GNAT family N-acetyltransferase n=1 Tax=Sulfidibacter corallicola TaxID=2818388 RepID=A0A8A4THN4_SULCO|nr:GNAT family N-acetyltransferase [Sulfidibacter corallicola]QTD49007.1 GNAT family N-acetyltransferase [Sulfidibacter corallicola]